MELAKKAAVIGSPVSHSLSPVIHNAAYRELGLDVSYEALEVQAEQVPDFLEQVRAEGWLGINVTTPLKQVVAEHVDELTADAEALDGVNSVSVRNGKLVGDSTDGSGLVRAIETVAGGVEGLKVSILGSGAAARSIVFALGRAGVSEVVIVNRTQTAAEAAAALAPAARVGKESDVCNSDIVINGTSVGMEGGPAPTKLVLAPEYLSPDQLVVDIVYNPLETPLLKAATELGCGVMDGRSMLLHQAALSIESWTQKPAPLAVMEAAIAD